MDRPIISISDGQIQGVTLKSVIGQTCTGFLGIPYAQPPVGSLRFKAPEPPKKWSGVRDASKFGGDVCPQNPTNIYQQQGVVLGSEDCLYLNVFTNDLSARGRPVMFYVHGGAFLEGNGNEHGYDYLVQMNAVLVFVNYRLGPMGFLSVGHEEASGNQSIRDIIMALKWVQKNIEAFGGDPGNMTIYGNSSGSATCHLLTILPAAKGLFHKAILQSGSAFMRGLIKVEDFEFKVGFRLASLLGMDSDDPVEVVEFLRRMPAEKLVALETKILTNEERIRLGPIPYFPVYDAKYCKDPVVPLPLKDLLKNDAHVPIMLGHTSDEGLLFFAGRFDDEELFTSIEKDFEENLRLKLLLKDETRFPEILKDMKEFYLKNKPVRKENFWDYIRFTSDVSVVYMNRKLVDLRIEHAATPTYLYCFSYLGDEPTIYQYDHGPQPLKGVAHADELSYLFNLNYMNRNGKEYPKHGTPDRLMIERMIRLWYNFAATGNPTPSTDKYVTTVWKPTTKDRVYYLDINTELTLKDDKNNESRKIYDKISDIFLSL